MKVVFSEEQLRLRGQRFLSAGVEAEHPEQPERATTLLDAALASGLQLETPSDREDTAIGAVHTQRYLEFLRTIHERWTRSSDSSAEILPNVHPLERSDGYPKSAVGQVGYHVYDASCPINADTWHSARWSALTALHAAEHVIDGDRACYALTRPPGHHASQDVAGGFCYLNNSALAAATLRRRFDRVAIIDVDVHHGNGTQRIFYERADVLTVSLHADPIRFYPFFWGYENETGRASGEGFNINVPLQRRTVDADYLVALESTLERVTTFSPSAIVVALGLDAHEDDPFQGMRISTEGFARIAMLLAALGLPTVLVQEGGYLSDALGRNLSSFLDGFRQAS